MIKILLVDDHLIVREGIKSVLRPYTDISVIAESVDGEDTMRRLKTLRPDLILIDVHMPKINGIEVLRRICSGKRPIKCVVLTAYPDEKYLVEAFKAGASGYLLKSATGEQIAEAIKTVAEDGEYFHDKLPKRLIKIVKQVIAARSAVEPVPTKLRPGRKRRDKLTLREIELMNLLGQGMRNKDIAEKLFLSEKTVKNHLTNIFRKLGVKDRTQALWVAMQQNLVIMP